MTRKLIGVLVAVMLLNATPASARTIEIDRARARSSGGFASAQAQGSVDDPKALIVEVISRPTNQPVRVLWNVFCGRGSEADARAGEFNVRTKVRKKLRMPYADPDGCSFAATVALIDGTGRITVILLARV